MRVWFYWWDQQLEVKLTVLPQRGDTVTLFPSPGHRVLGTVREVHHFIAQIPFVTITLNVTDVTGG